MTPLQVRRWLCWLPLGSLLAVELSIRGYDGWGAWAAAPLLLIPGFVSLAVILWGLANRPRPKIPFMLVAALPLLWLGVRRFIL